MRDRDVWSHGSGRQLQDMLASALVTLLIPVRDQRPVYFASPWMSDFVLFPNAFRQVAPVLPTLAERTEIHFADYLVELALLREVRVITTRTDTSAAFATRLRGILRQRDGARVAIRFAPDDAHEKGILTPTFYIGGSMNITYSGVYVRGEKVTYHVATDEDRDRIERAYNEFGRQWELFA